MALNKSKGNMYTWVTHMWSPWKGCHFECPYCYGRKYGYDVGMDEEDLRTTLGRGKIIFVGHLCDMWGPWVSKEDIDRILFRCSDYRENEYVFQSKNPGRFWDFRFKILPGSLLGTTIETDRYPDGFKTKAPTIAERVEAMAGLPIFKKFVTIEPIMDFELANLTLMIHRIRPDFVTIGADSKGNHLKEPSWEKVEKLIHRLSQFVEIRQKTNLERLEGGA